MRIFTRHILSQVTKVFVFSLIALTTMLIIGGVVREAMNQNLPAAQVVRLIPYLLPEVLRVALPVTLLLATTTIYSAMSGSNEVVAIKALGISPWLILWPTMVLAFLLSLLTVWLNDLAVSWGRNGVQRVIVEAVEEIAYNMLSTPPNGYSSSSFSINVKGVDGRRLIAPLLTIKGRGSTPNMTITADEAELRSDREQNMLKIILRNSTIDLEGQVTIRNPGVYEQEIPLSDASRAKPLDRRPSQMALRDIPDEVEEQKALITEVEEDMVAEAGQQLLHGDFPALTSGEWQLRQAARDSCWGQLYRLYTEPHRRWSAGFSCLCFVWIGAPMAIWLRNRDFLTSFFLCFLPILTVYYPLLMCGVNGSKDGMLPPYSVWAGNVILAAWGAWMLRKVLRY
jgi:lipopolysaccharide export system permease protein